MDPYLAKLIGRTPNTVDAGAAPPYNVLQWRAQRVQDSESRSAHEPSRKLRKAKGLTPGTTKYTSRGRTFLLITGSQSELQQRLLLLDELFLIEHERRRQQYIVQRGAR